MNLLSKRDAAIVSEQEGTTRDVIETYLNVDGYPVILADTAGIRKAKNKVEKEGIMKELKRRRYYLKPSERKKEKRIAAAKRRRKVENRMRQRKQ